MASIQPIDSIKQHVEKLTNTNKVIGLSHCSKKGLTIMGVHLHLAAISDFNISRLMAHPQLIWTLVTAETRFPASRYALEPECITLRESLGEYWHGIHYLLCGQGWNGQLPDAFLLDGGSYVGNVDLGYGPARTFDSGEVKHITQALVNKTPETLRQHFDTNQMLDEDIYPPIWDGNTQALDACLKRFQAMQHFMRHVAENDLGLAVYLQET